MLEIKFEFEDPNNELTGLNMGHMTFNGDKGSVSSAMSVPSQAMIILIAISDLLDGLREYILSDTKKYNFVGADSSFTVSFEKVDNNHIKVKIGNKEITVIEQSKLILSVLNDINAFLKVVLPQLPKDDIVYNDIITSVERFKKIKSR